MTEHQVQLEIIEASVNIIASAPDMLLERVGEEDGTVPLRSITTTTATAVEDILKNTSFNLSKGYNKFRDRKDFKQPKGNKPIAIVGGAPSLKKQLNKLFFDFDVIMSAGSPNDYLVRNGIKPNYVALCDPSEVVNNYLKELCYTTEYLVASCCDPKVFERLKNNKIYLWNCYGDAIYQWCKENYPEEDYIGGGCTIGLRAINLASMLGYTNIHLFGMDSCMSEDEYYAYELVDPAEKEGIGANVYEIKIGRNGQKRYKVAGYQLAQADHFKDFLQMYHKLVTFTIHGDGLLKDVHEDFLVSNNLKEAVV